MDEEELVTIARFELANEAELAKLHLEEAGIRACLTDAETVNMDWLLGAAVGYIKVQVAASQAEEATQVLADHAPPADADASADDEETDEITKCLSCGQTLADDVEKCPSCGWSYDGEPEPEMPAEPAADTSTAIKEKSTDITADS
ncbi:MAG: hypothetical protein FJ303_02285 [Planctomycetes bacterium]|nr:hypothetical protein [Planctomycetota bacterium]